ncbi:MAG: DUF504 domain-containing protein [Thermoproteota archaeon]|nr:DUF504 domain-containing protein [Thermoproteota archaeon]
MVRKGIIEEIFSKAQYVDNPTDYTITYRDFENYKEVNMKEFLLISENLQVIPVSRITMIRKGNTTLYNKHQQH